MKTRHHQQGTATRKWHSVAAVLAFVLSIFAAPAAMAAPIEGDTPGTSTAETALDHGAQRTTDIEYWPQRQLENLIGQEAGASDTSSYRAQQEAYLRFLEQKANAASSGEPAVETGAADSGQPWLLGVGLVTAVTVASILAAIVRSRRPETVTQLQRDRDKVNV